MIELLVILVKFALAIQIVFPHINFGSVHCISVKTCIGIWVSTTLKCKSI